MLSFRYLISFLFLALFLSPKIISQEDIFICGTDNKNIVQYVEQLRATNWTLKILLVEFQDVKHKSPGYTYTNFNNLFFSSGIYVSPNMYSPDGQQVFGSMNDYLSIMSDGEFTLTGYVVNADANSDNIPDWLTLPNTKMNYSTSGGFESAVTAAANAAGYNISTSGSVKLAIIYAGHTYRSVEGSHSYLNPHASGNYYTMGELFAAFSPYQSERPDAKFSEIGINVHEFLHLTGENDLYLNGNWDIMNGGPVLGPNSRGACPAPLNPQSRYKKGWMDVNLVTTNRTFQADYYLQDPEVFRINNSTNSGNYWLIETRKFNGTMTIGTTTTNDYNTYITSGISNPPSKGVLVWKIVSSNGDGTILRADGQPWPGWPPTSGGTLFPGTGNVKVLSPWSDSRTTPTWVPNTKPSTNVGMEIVSESTNYFTIDFYANNPQNASPSKPQNCTIAWNGTHPQITWATNKEPDIQSYKIYKSIEGSGFGMVATVTNNPDLTTHSWIDNNVIKPGKFDPHWEYAYKIKAIDNTSKESVFSNKVSIIGWGDMWKNNVKGFEESISEYFLINNYPNPFNPTTLIRYSIKKEGLVSLKVFDVLGKEVAVLVNEVKPAGVYEAEFNALDLPSGVYIYSLRINDFTSNQKMLLLK